MAFNVNVLDDTRATTLKSGELKDLNDVGCEPYACSVVLVRSRCLTDIGKPFLSEAAAIASVLSALNDIRSIAPRHMSDFTIRSAAYGILRSEAAVAYELGKDY